jgi:hypothetical protein
MGFCDGIQDFQRRIAWAVVTNPSKVGIEVWLK